MSVAEASPAKFFPVYLVPALAAILCETRFLSQVEHTKL